MFSIKNIFHTNTCRLCLQVDVKVFKLGDTYKTFLETFFRMNKCDFSFLADYCVCYICFKQLSNFYDFIQKVGNAQLIIRGLYKNYNMATEALIRNVDKTVCQMNLTKSGSFTIFTTLESVSDLDISEFQNNADLGIEGQTSQTDKSHDNFDDSNSSCVDPSKRLNDNKSYNTPAVAKSDVTLINDLLSTSSNEASSNNITQEDEPFETFPVFKTEQDDPLNILEIEETQINVTGNNLVINNTCKAIDTKVNDLDYNETKDNPLNNLKAGQSQTNSIQKLLLSDIISKEIDNKINELHCKDLKKSRTNSGKCNSFNEATCSSSLFNKKIVETIEIDDDILETPGLNDIDIQFTNCDPFNNDTKEEKVTEACDPLDNLTVENKTIEIDIESPLSPSNPQFIEIEMTKNEEQLDPFINKESDDTRMLIDLEANSDLDTTCNTSEFNIKIEKDKSEDELANDLHLDLPHPEHKRRTSSKTTHVYKDDNETDEDKKPIKKEKVPKASSNKKPKKKSKQEDEDYKPDQDSTSHSEDSDFDQYNDEGKRVAKPKKRKYPRPCEMCDFEVFSANEHYRHYINVHLEEQYPYKREKTHACTICGKLLNSQKLRLHEEKHDTSSTIKCPMCPKVFSTKAGCQKHVFCVHKKNRYECDYCSKQFKTKSDLERHIRIHTGEKPYPCHICGEAFAHKGNTVIHIRNKHQNVQYVPKKRKQKNIAETDTDSDEPQIEKSVIWLQKNKKGKHKNDANRIIFAKKSNRGRKRTKM